jgi:precorrin-6A/cobalt-precorrin-6A reductase
MVLLIGGTSETSPLAVALAAIGFKVLVSTATDVPLDVGKHPNLSHRSGKLDREDMARLISDRGVRVLVDASHPYATSVRSNARSVSEQMGIPYVSFLRPTTFHQDDFIHLAENHDDGARKACSFGSPVLLTTGSRNLVPYIDEAERTGVRLIARVLQHPDSMEACRKAGIPDKDVLTGRGPFTTADNRSTIRRFSIGCLVTKDSGEAGGVPEKIEAARQEGCNVVMIQRPCQESDGATTLEGVVNEVRRLMTSIAGDKGKQ